MSKRIIVFLLIVFLSLTVLILRPRDYCVVNSGAVITVTYTGLQVSGDDGWLGDKVVKVKAEYSNRTVHSWGFSSKDGTCRFRVECANPPRVAKEGRAYFWPAKSIHSQGIPQVNTNSMISGNTYNSKGEVLSSLANGNGTTFEDVCTNLLVEVAYEDGFFVSSKPVEAGHELLQD